VLGAAAQDDAGGQVLLDGRTRRAGSHHQKLVVVRHPAAPARDAAFVGGDLGFSRNDDSEHGGDPQVMDDSELSIAVLDAERDARPPLDRGDADADVANLLDPAEAFAAFRRQALALEAWHAGGQRGERPAGRVRPHQPHRPTTAQRLWAAPLYRLVYDPDGRPWRDRLRGRL
jgi:hypothetical protein